MTKDKQIEELTRVICSSNRNGICDYDRKPCNFDCGSYLFATKVYNAGYRKASEVVREIFDEVDEIAYRYLNDADYSGGDMIYDLNELKKIYTEEVK